MFYFKYYDLFSSRNLLAGDEDYFVSDYIPELTTSKILTTELIHGVPLDVVADMDQETRDWVGIDYARPFDRPTKCFVSVLIITVKAVINITWTCP